MRHQHHTTELPTLTAANAHFVTSYLAVGGDLSWDDRIATDQIVDLVLNGVTHVLDVRKEAHDALVWEDVPSVSYLWAGIDNAGQRVPGAWFDHVTYWAREAIGAGGVVLTHCHMGINRGPSAGFAVLIDQGWDPVDALAAIRAARPIANVWYAEDAVKWHLDRTGASPREHEATRARVARWRTLR